MTENNDEMVALRKEVMAQIRRDIGAKLKRWAELSEWAKDVADLPALSIADRLRGLPRSDREIAMACIRFHQRFRAQEEKEDDGDT